MTLHDVLTGREPMTGHEWVPPSDPDEAEYRIIQNALKSELIQAQLGTKSRVNFETGQVMTNAEFEDWHTRAKLAFAHTKAERALLKQWLKQYNRSIDRDYGGVVIARACQFVDDDTEEAFDKLVVAVNEMREKQAEAGR